MEHASTPAVAPPTRFRRRGYLVDRRFQLKYTLLLAGLGLVLALVPGLGAWQAHRQSLEIAVTDPMLRAAVEAGDRHLLLVAVGIALAVSLSLALVGLVVTHHVAGPVYVMSHYLSALAQGRYPRMRPLRRGDELKEFFELFQRAVSVMRERESRHATISEEVVRRMRNVLDRAPDLQPAIAALEGLVREERAAVGGEGSRAERGGGAPAGRPAS
jgi:hypothetical protein